MTDKIKDKKVQGVSSTKEASGVQGPDAVSTVGEVQATQAVGAVKEASGVGGAKFRQTKVMTAEQRRKLMSLIQDEADKMRQDGTLSPENMEIVAKAVTMAVNASMEMGEDDEERKKPSKKGSPKK